MRESIFPRLPFFFPPVDASGVKALTHIPTLQVIYVGASHGSRAKSDSALYEFAELSLCKLSGQLFVYSPLHYSLHGSRSNQDNKLITLRADEEIADNNINQNFYNETNRLWKVCNCTIQNKHSLIDKTNANLLLLLYCIAIIKRNQKQQRVRTIRKPKHIFLVGCERRKKYASKQTLYNRARRQINYCCEWLGECYDELYALCKPVKISTVPEDDSEDNGVCVAENSLGDKAWCAMHCHANSTQTPALGIPSVLLSKSPAGTLANADLVYQPLEGELGNTAEHCTSTSSNQNDNQDEHSVDNEECTDSTDECASLASDDDDDESDEDSEGQTVHGLLADGAAENAGQQCTSEGRLGNCLVDKPKDPIPDSAVSDMTAWAFIGRVMQGRSPPKEEDKLIISVDKYGQREVRSVDKQGITRTLSAHLRPQVVEAPSISKPCGLVIDTDQDRSVNLLVQQCVPDESEHTHDSPHGRGGCVDIKNQDVRCGLCDEPVRTVQGWGIPKGGVRRSVHL